VQQSKSVIILTPEISLTPQLVEFFKKTFGEKILLTHSGLTPSQRAKVWLKCLSGKGPWIVMGPRSALFSPLSDLGMVVVDESHDSSYKQDRLPFYNALRVAGYLCANTKSKLIMGSATPAVNEYFLAKAKDIPILPLNKKAIKEKSPTEIKIVDITDKGERSNYPLLGKTLIKNISEAIENNIQSMVFINKRGDSKSIVCQNCGWRAKCGRCDLPLTYHSDESVFSCHTCGNDYPARTSCQLCGSPDIIFKSPGTKAIAKSLSKIFPHAVVARFDTDNKKAERIDSRHKEIVSGDIDILVGTQLITKGHDLPRLGIAAMLVAESDLNFPDFTAEEKTFQSIRQLSGRVGRGHLPGMVIQPKKPLDKTSYKRQLLGILRKPDKREKRVRVPPILLCTENPAPARILKIFFGRGRKTVRRNQKNLSQMYNPRPFRFLLF
jgi:primosomal protein N' (replication factor Y)